MGLPSVHGRTGAIESIVHAHRQNGAGCRWYNRGERKDKSIAEGGEFSIKEDVSVRRGRHMREYLTGYLMISPAMVLIFTFGIFPVGFALYVSLHKWRLKKGDFLGLNNYVGGVDNP